MGYLGRRIGKSQNTGRSEDGADGNLGGGIIDLFDRGYFAREGNISRSPNVVPAGMSASGGILNEFTQNGNVYRSHTFTGSGNFVVSSLSSDFPNTVEYLVVAGGASAGARAGGGGGAGGLKSTDPAVPTDRRGSAVPVAVASYPVVIGAGGATASVANIARGNAGGTSSFAYNGGTISCSGGGGGGAGVSPDPDKVGLPGASGGGGFAPGTGSTGSAGGAASPNSNPDRQGYPGGSGYHVGSVYIYGGGGGGASEAGGNAPTNGAPDYATGAGVGGDGFTTTILGSSQAFGGGGGGGAQPGPTATSGGNGGLGGGGAGLPGPGGTSKTGGSGFNAGGSTTSSDTRGGDGGASTGGGGGGGCSESNRQTAGAGGSGIVVLRYQIGTTERGTAKATGGQIATANGYIIHTFTGSGNFVTQPNWTDGNVTYLIVGGGGGGGSVTPANAPWSTGGAGGGGGGVRYGTTPVTGVNTTVAVVVGAGGLNSTHDNLQATNGGPSSFGTPLTAGGGGFGGTRAPTPYFPGGAGNEYGGSGGGATWSGNPGAAGSNSTPHPGGIDAASPSTQGFGHAGQNVGPPQPYVGGGGGGAGGTNTDAAPVADNSGGVGARYTIANGITGNAPDAVYYGGGGGGGLGTDGGTPSGSPDGTGGTGGDNDPHTNGTPGMENRGGGGGGGAARGTDAKSDTFRPGGKGGSGVVIIAYPA